jgi:putative heme degradation protein
MPQSFEQMNDAERQEWRSELQRRSLDPGAVSYVDPSRESVYEFRPDLNATVETLPDGHRFIVVFRDGELKRQEALDEKKSKSRWFLSQSFVWRFEAIALTGVFVLSFLPERVVVQSVLAVALLAHFLPSLIKKSRER